MDGIVGETRLGNTQLIEYGIQNEKSDIRAHVSYASSCVYVYETVSGLKAIENDTYRTAPAYQSGIKTGVGYLVPPRDISGCQTVSVSREFMQDAGFISKSQSQSAKGDAAVNVVTTLLKSGEFPVDLSVATITDEDLQISGTDIQVKTDINIQVKCDWDAGEGGTGNLFLQIQECNPFKRY